jgi:7,8-dihydropterin-6-yl-methyl-4-(beta-D-ribofuranosyl)aminobenzene 5'-phosphate synthase
LEVRVLVDDIAPAGIPSARGFAALVETSGPRILFDTGPDGEILLEALERETIDPRSIDLVVVSHSHPDHIGGLAHLLHDRPRLEVSAPAASAPGIARRLPKEAVVLAEAAPREVAEGVRVTGDLGGSIPEQALLMEMDGGWAAVVGCGHYGLEALVASADGELAVIVGGLHDLSASNPMLSWVGRLVACHCTPNKRVLAHRLDNVEVGAVGSVVQLAPP